MKRQSINNKKHREAHNLVRFSTDIRFDEREACTSSAYSCAAIVRAGMKALGIKAITDNSVLEDQVFETNTESQHA